MKAMILAFACIVLIAFGASVTLERLGYSAQERTSGSAVRLD